MRGSDGYNESLFLTVKLEDFVPANHPLRPIRTWLNETLSKMDERFSANGKAQRFIQSALCEWAYGWTYQNSSHRTAALASWQYHYWHRPHGGIGVAPIARLGRSAHNVVTLRN